MASISSGIPMLRCTGPSARLVPIRDVFFMRNSIASIPRVSASSSTTVSVAKAALVAPGAR